MWFVEIVYYQRNLQFCLLKANCIEKQLQNLKCPDAHANRRAHVLPANLYTILPN